MKPQNLKTPFSFASRKIFYENGLLHIPDFLDKYDATHLAVDTLLPGPISVELCSGNGHWVCDMAKQNPKKSYVAVEKRFDRVQKIWSKKQNENLDNLLIIWGKAQLLMKYFCSANTIDEFLVHFPDPWPKNRQRKHRLFQEPLLSDIKKSLKAKGRVILVTDHYNYGMGAYKSLQNAGFRSQIQDPGYRIVPSYANSTFEDLWKRLDRKIYYFSFEVIHE